MHGDLREKYHNYNHILNAFLQAFFDVLIPIFFLSNSYRFVF